MMVMNDNDGYGINMVHINDEEEDKDDKVDPYYYHR